MKAKTRDVVFWVAVGLAVLLGLSTAWNAAIVSTKASAAEVPPTVSEWGSVLTVGGGSVLSTIVAVFTWASQYWSGQRQSFFVKWLPVLETMLDVESGKSVDEVVIRFGDGSERTLKLGPIATSGGGG